MYGSTPLFHWYYLLSSPLWDIPHWCGVRRLVRGRGSRSKWVRVPIRVRVWIRVGIRVKRVRVRVRRGSQYIVITQNKDFVGRI